MQHHVSRSNVVILSVLVTSGALSIQACARKQAGRPQADPKYVAARESLQRFEAGGQKLQAETAAIRKRLDAITDDLPGLAAFRSNLFATEEVLGGVGGTAESLATELETAFAAGDPQQVERVTALIASSAESMKSFEKTVLDQSHALIPFERKVAQFRALAAAGVFFTRVLPTGYEVRAANRGIEERLLSLVSAPKPAKKAPRAMWLDFDRIWFAGDGADLDSEPSSEQLENVAAILTAYPNVTLEIAGYDDDDAPPAAAAKKLAPARAEAVKARLVSLGVAEARLNVAGHGRIPPRCTASAGAKCRAERPRIAARIALEPAKRLSP